MCAYLAADVSFDPNELTEAAPAVFLLSVGSSKTGGCAPLSSGVVPVVVVVVQL